MSYQGTYEDYKVKQALYDKAVAHEPVDTIPCLFAGPALSPRLVGMSQKEFCLNGDSALQSSLDAIRKVGDFDGINMMQSGLFPVLIGLLWLSKVLIPGIDLPEDDLWQVKEQMIMQDDDYDFIIDKGWDAFVQKTLPKVMDMKLLEENNAWMEAKFTSVADHYRNIGYMIAAAGIATIPFEPICGARSMSKFFLDLYRMPDKVKAAMDVAAPVMTEQAIGAVKASGVDGVWVGGWRTASAMIAPDIWNKLVWPYFRDVSMALIDAGITPVFHWDQCWDRDLERLKELPAKKCVLSLDGMTDIRLAKKILRDHTAVMGDVPAPLFATGTTEEMRQYVHDLVRDLGTEGFILCSGCDAPINTKPENMRAFLDASREFGAGV